MKWILVWIVSIATIYISAFHYNFYSSIDELLRSHDLGAFLIVLLIGVISSGGSFIAVFILKKMLLKIDMKINMFVLTVLTFILSISFCVIIVKRLSVILTET